MTRLSTPILHVEGETSLVAYEVTPPPGGPRWFHVSIRTDPYGPDILTFAGNLVDLHEFLLGLHNVLVDAGQSPDGRADRVVLTPTEAADLDRLGDELDELDP
ncbi:MAG TPA: hypothetical protein VFU25_04155 [Ornithinibacter sp.]|nr:hypothetical protein [Ornithinibacter sp.]